MARKRKNPEDNKLLLRVYKTKYCYYFKPTSKENLSLGKVTMTMSELWNKYDALLAEMADVMTFVKLWNKFLLSAYYLDLVARTQSEARSTKKLECLIPSTFHDLKAKSISDYEGSSRDKQILSGHKTEGQVLVYDRKTKVTPTLNLPIVD